MGRRLVPGLAFLVLLGAGILPLLAMLFQSLAPGGKFSLAAYEGILASRRQWILMGNSLALSSLVTLLATAAGLPLGILLGKSDLPLRRLFLFLFALPLLVPPYITAVSWFDLLGGDGLLAGLLGPSFSAAATGLLFGLPGCVLVLFATFLPIPILLTMVSLRAVDPRLEEAARMVAPWRGVLKGVTLPLLSPGLLLAALLVFLLTFGEFGVPAYLRFQVFPVESFTHFSAFYDFKAATAAALPMAAVTLLLLLGEAFFLEKRPLLLRPSAGGEEPLRIELGKSRKWILALVALAAFFLVVLPLLSLLARTAGPAAFGPALEKAGGSLLRSLLYAFLGATLLSVLGFFLGYLVQARAFPFWRFADWLTLFLFALPGTVIGIGLISLWNHPWTNLVYATPAIVLLGYLAKYSALTNRITAVQLSLLPPSMEEAAQAAGASWGRRILWITAPLAGRGILAAWLTAFLFCLRDTGITMIVYPPGRETLPVRIFTLMANGAPELISALCVLMLAAALLPAGVLALLFRKKNEKEVP